MIIVINIMKNDVLELILKILGDVSGLCVIVCINKLDIVNVLLINNFVIIFGICMLCNKNVVFVFVWLVI